MKKIVAWGCGKIADRYMRCYYPVLQKRCEVVGFVDTNKKNEFFYGKPVWKYTDDINEKFDNLVIMISNPVEVYDDLRNHESRLLDKTLWIHELFAECINDDWMEFKKASVLFYGDRSTYDYAKYRAQFTFFDVEFVELGQEVIGERDYVMICPPRLIEEEKIIAYERECTSYLKQQNVSASKAILKWEEWHYYMECDRIIRKNKKSDRTFYILAVSDPIRGWGNLLIQILGGINYAKKKRYIPIVDMQNIENQYLRPEDLGKHNAWDDFFEPLNRFSLDDAYGSENCVLCGVDSNLYEKKDWKDIQLKECLIKEKEKWIEKNFDKNRNILGVVYRGTDYYRAGNGHIKPLEKQYFLEKVEEYRKQKNYQQIFLATEVQEIVELFQSKYGDDVKCFPQKRYAESERKLLAEIEDTRWNGVFLRGKEYLLVLCILSECDGLYGTENGATRLSLVMNQGKYRDVEIVTMN